MRTVVLGLALGSIALLSGCAGYTWGTSVPEEYRTVAVPVFENLTEVSEMGPTVTQYTLREFQREGTFKVARQGDAAIEVQGVVKFASAALIHFKRTVTMRAYEQRLVVSADVSVVDRRSGKVVVNNRRYVAETTYFSDTDIATARRDASGRAVEDLARQIVDDVTSCRWDDTKAKEAVK